MANGGLQWQRCATPAGQRKGTTQNLALQAHKGGPNSDSETSIDANEAALLASTIHEEAPPTSGELPLVSPSVPKTTPSESEIIPKKKRKGRKLTLAPPPKKQALLAHEEITSEVNPEYSLEQTLSALYPSLSTLVPTPTHDNLPLLGGSSSPDPSASPRETLSASAQEDPALISILFFLPSSQAAISPTSLLPSTLPILLGDEIIDSWSEAKNRLSELPSKKLADEFCYARTKQWTMSMSMTQHLYDLAQENKLLKQQNSETTFVKTYEQIKELSTQLQEAWELARMELENPLNGKPPWTLLKLNFS
ncbi:uncharacterized protein LOC122026742 [Zingiber officinale]|uniref:uncharacterized protein LOC122026742 n=1 Tax=Zingiber officinale TaxID=94328 RepID=UPI001C4B740F|nr:uncharacterized protein LOC122026742 [Zingiber officinale]